VAATRTLTDNLAAHLDQFLVLEAEASKPYNNFVYGNDEQAYQLRRLLLQAGVSEFGSPYARLMLDDGRVTGMIACLTGKQLLQVRMKGALALRKAGVLTPELQDRLRLAGQTLIKPNADDFYLSRIAIAPGLRGQGAGSFLMNYFEDEARTHNCARLTLEVNALDEPAVRFYCRHKFSELSRLKVNDEATGRSLEYQQMSKLLA